MRKLLVLAGLLLAGIVVARRLRSRVGGGERQPTATPPAPARAPALDRLAPPIERTPEVEPEPAAPTATPPPTTNGERVVLMSIWSLQERGEAATQEAVVGHVAAGEVDPDEGTVDAVLHRLVATDLLSGGGASGPYGLTERGQAALEDLSRARPSPAGDAADELSSPMTGP